MISCNPQDKIPQKIENKFEFTKKLIKSINYRDSKSVMYFTNVATRSDPSAPDNKILLLFPINAYQLLTKVDSLN